MAAATSAFRHLSCRLSGKDEALSASSQARKVVAPSKRLTFRGLRTSCYNTPSVRSGAVNPARAADDATSAGDVASVSESSAVDPAIDAVPRKHAIIHDFCIGITFGERMRIFANSPMLLLTCVLVSEARACIAANVSPLLTCQWFGAVRRSAGSLHADTESHEPPEFPVHHSSLVRPSEQMLAVKMHVTSLPLFTMMDQ